MNTPFNKRPALSRREALKVIAVTASGTMAPRALWAQESDGSTLLPGSNVCILTPEVTEGPYYFDPKLVRRDIRENRAGVPTVLRLQVFGASCAPIEDARVDVWHCDALGVYSSFGGDSGQVSEKGETFLRGTQMTDAYGRVDFLTIYPGWYRGRTTHIHFKAFVDQANVLTGQIFFPDALSEYLYLNVPAYKRGVIRDTFNDSDGIARSATRASFATVKEDEEVYLAQLIVGVDPAARSVQPVGPEGGRLPPPGTMPPPGQGPRIDGSVSGEARPFIPGTRSNDG